MIASIKPISEIKVGDVLVLQEGLRTWHTFVNDIDGNTLATCNGKTYTGKQFPVLEGPFGCEYFLMCDNQASGFYDAGPVGIIPACDRCLDRVYGEEQRPMPVYDGPDLWSEL